MTAFFIPTPLHVHAVIVSQPSIAGKKNKLHELPDPRYSDMEWIGMYLKLLPWPSAIHKERNINRLATAIDNN